jgi:hypothetical protein
MCLVRTSSGAEYLSMLRLCQRSTSARVSGMSWIGGIGTVSAREHEAPPLGESLGRPLEEFARAALVGFATRAVHDRLQYAFHLLIARRVLSDLVRHLPNEEAARVGDQRRALGFAAGPDRVRERGRGEARVHLRTLRQRSRFAHPPLAFHVGGAFPCAPRIVERRGLDTRGLDALVTLPAQAHLVLHLGQRARHDGAGLAVERGEVREMAAVPAVEVGLARLRHAHGGRVHGRPADLPRRARQRIAEFGVQRSAIPFVAMRTRVRSQPGSDLARDLAQRRHMRRRDPVHAHDKETLGPGGWARSAFCPDLALNTLAFCAALPRQ